MSDKMNGCGTKHMKVIGIVVIIVIAIVGTAFAYTSGKIESHDIRLRKVEQTQSAVKTEIKNVGRTLERMERKLDEIHKAESNR